MFFLFYLIHLINFKHYYLKSKVLKHLVYYLTYNKYFWHILFKQSQTCKLYPLWPFFSLLICIEINEEKKLMLMMMMMMNLLNNYAISDQDKDTWNTQCLRVKLIKRIKQLQVLVTLTVSVIVFVTFSLFLLI